MNGGGIEKKRGGDRDRERPGEKRNPEEKRNARDGDTTADDKGSLVYKAGCSSRGNEQKIHGDATCPNLGVKSQICWMIVDTKPCWALIALLPLLVSNNGLPSLCVARPTITTTPNEIKHLTDITQNNSHE